MDVREIALTYLTKWKKHTFTCVVRKASSIACNGWLQAQSLGTVAVLVSNPNFWLLALQAQELAIRQHGRCQKMTVSKRKLLSICEDMDCEYLMKQFETRSQGSIEKTSILPWNIMKNHLVE